jgi:zinc transport system permease protein
LPVDFLNYLLLTLVSIAVVLLIQVVGLILVLALLTLPSAVAAYWARGMKTMVLLSSVTALFSIFIGLEAAVNLDWPAGPVIILSSASVFGLSMTIVHLRSKHAKA